MYSVTSETFIRMKNTPEGVFSSVKLVEIMCDTESDVPEPLPDWEIGSSCFIVDTQEVRFLNSQGVWV